MGSVRPSDFLPNCKPVFKNVESYVIQKRCAVVPIIPFLKNSNVSFVHYELCHQGKIYTGGLFGVRSIKLLLAIFTIADMLKFLDFYLQL